MPRLSYVFIFIFIQIFLLSVTSQTFYEVFKINDRDQFRGISKNPLMLAMATEKFVIFGILHSNFTFAEANRILLTKDLMGKGKLIAFEFVGLDSVIVCDSKGCSICHLLGPCITVIENSTIESINIQFKKDLLFTQVTHNKNDGVIYSFKLENGKYSLIGLSQDRTTTKNEFKSITSFPRYEHVYFVSRVKRRNLNICLSGSNETEEDQSEANVEIVLTQICDNDESEKILSRRDIILSCGERNLHNSTSYSQNGTIYRNTLRNNVIAATYLKHDDSLFVVIEDSPGISIFCEFNMSEIEKEFCNVWSFCQNDYITNEFNDCGDDEKYFNYRCFKTSESENFCKTADKMETYVSQNCISKPSQNFHTFGTLYPFFGKPFANVIKEKYLGVYSTDQGLFALLKDKLTKVTSYSLDITIIYHLHEFSLESEMYFTFWDTKIGILYINPKTKNSVYFKEMLCFEKVCNEIMFDYFIKCGLCSLNYPGECVLEEKAETFCAPLWYTFHESESANPNKTYSKTNLMATYNGVSRRINCVPVYDETIFTCSKTLKSYLQSSFTVPISASDVAPTVGHLLFQIIIFIVLVVCTICCGICVKKIFCKPQRPVTTTTNKFQDVTYTKIKSDCLIDKSQIVALRKIGEGFSGIVELSNYTNGGEVKKVAVKYLRESGLLKSIEELRLDMLKEIEELRSCKHPNIVTFIGWIDSEPRMAVVTEFMAGGDLHAYISNPQKPLKFSTAFSFISQILDGMVYLSHNKILHRDLAARNCLLNESYSILKISDFGLARKMNIDYEYYQQNQRALAFRWASLEAITSNFKFTVKLDIWSFAVVVWEIFQSGAVPFENMERIDVLNYLTSGKRLSQPRHCPLELYNTMLWCWDEKPEDRPNFAALKDDVKAIYSHIKIYEPKKVDRSIRINNVHGYELPDP